MKYKIECEFSLFWFFDFNFLIFNPQIVTKIGLINCLNGFKHLDLCKFAKPSVNFLDKYSTPHNSAVSVIL